MLQLLGIYLLFNFKIMSDVICPKCKNRIKNPILDEEGNIAIGCIAVCENKECIGIDTKVSNPLNYSFLVFKENIN